MNTLETIAKRRSIRKYTGKAVTDDQLHTLLQAAMLAPTARNCQEWDFVVVRERQTLDKLMEVHPYAQALATAGCAIVVCANLTREMAAGYWPGDCGAATQNILLAATELGLGTLWMGVCPNEERMKGVAEVLGLPEHVKPFCLIAVGWPDEQKAEVERFDPAKVHQEKW